MKKFTKIGRVGELYTRTIKLNEAVAVSFEVGGQRFSATFSPQKFDLETGDLVKIEYEKDGFLNKILTFETLAKNNENASKSAKFLNIFAFVCFVCISLLLFSGIVTSLVTSGGEFSFGDITTLAILCTTCCYLAVSAAASKFKILRHFA
nr:hypothetical protein [uncultured Campylobacter sp.]